VIPIGSAHLEYAEKVGALLKAKGVRVEVDRRGEKIGYKIRDAQVQKIPYMLVVGDKEVEAGTVSVRERSAGDLGVMTVEAFAERVLEEAGEKCRCC